MQDLTPGTEFAGYRIESIEREDAATAVLRAQDPVGGRVVALHIATEPPGSVSTVSFLERAHRLQGVAHPNLLPVYDTVSIGGRSLAIAQAPPGRRLDGMLREGSLPPERATRIARQVASAVEALEGAGAELPPITPERVWVNGGHAYLDPLDGRSVLARADRPPSSPAALAALLDAMLREQRSSPTLRTIAERAREGAYFSIAQVSDALDRLDAGAADRARRRRLIALAIAALATLAVIAVLVLTLT